MLVLHAAESADASAITSYARFSIIVAGSPSWVSKAMSSVAGEARSKRSTRPWPVSATNRLLPSITMLDGTNGTRASEFASSTSSFRVTPTIRTDRGSTGVWSFA